VLGTGKHVKLESMTASCFFSSVRKRDVYCSLALLQQFYTKRREKPC